MAIILRCMSSSVAAGTAAGEMTGRDGPGTPLTDTALLLLARLVRPFKEVDILIFKSAYYRICGFQSLRFC